MSAAPRPQITPQEYLEIERKAATKSEYYAGEMFGMAGASREHNLIAVNVLASIHRQFVGRPCEVYAGDMRVKVSASGLYTYPDIIALCGKPIFDDLEADTLLNPMVIIEVLSKSTEGYDRGAEFEHYRKLESLEEFILVAQNKCHVEQFVRQPDRTWVLLETENRGEILKVRSIRCELSIAEIYDKVMPLEPA